MAGGLQHHQRGEICVLVPDWSTPEEENKTISLIREHCGDTECAFLCHSHSALVARCQNATWETEKVSVACVQYYVRRLRRRPRRAELMGDRWLGVKGRRSSHDSRVCVCVCVCVGVCACVCVCARAQSPNCRSCHIIVLPVLTFLLAPIFTFRGCQIKSGVIWSVSMSMMYYFNTKINKFARLLFFFFGVLVK